MRISLHSLCDFTSFQIILFRLSTLYGRVCEASETNQVSICYNDFIPCLVALHHDVLLYQPRHEKTCLRGLRSGMTQTGLLGYRDEGEAWNFGFSKYRKCTIQAAKKKGADQTARMRRLICAFVVGIWHKQVFSWRGSMYHDWFSAQLRSLEILIRSRLDQLAKRTFRYRYT